MPPAITSPPLPNPTSPSQHAALILGAALDNCEASMTDIDPSERSGLRRHRPGFLAVVAVVLLLARYGSRVVSTTRGHLAYTIDDSHIHLRLAQQIVRGTYGINPHVAASPSSSMLWPFLLAAFARWSFVAWVPLILNSVCAIATTWVAYLALARAWTRSARPELWAALGALGVLIGSDSLAIVFTGMEHSLQILLTVVIAFGLIRIDADRPSTRSLWWLWAALVVLPWVRYEGLVVDAVFVAALILLGYWRPALAAGVAAVAGLVAFGVFLTALGLEPIPDSVLVKAQRPRGQSYAGFAWSNLRQGFTASGVARIPALMAVVAVLTLVVAALLARSGCWRRGTLLLVPSAVIVITVQLLAGTSIGRYVAYAVALVLVAVAAAAPVIVERRSPWLRIPVSVGVALLLLVTSYEYHQSLVAAGRNAQSIFDQQYQMHRFVVDDLRAPVAVNDLGQVSYDDPYYVLDLAGLGDDDVRKAARAGEPAWMDHVMAKHGVEVAMIYRDWFAGQIPSSWILAGRLHSERRGAPAEQTVDIFTRSPNWARRVRTALREFRPTHPRATEVEIVRDGGTVR